MKIKRYPAVSMRAALAQVRAEQGPDAVILSSRRGDEGIEVIAAVDYDEALFVDANRQRPAPIMVPSVTDPVAPAAAMAPSTLAVLAAAKAPMSPKAPHAAAPRPAAAPAESGRLAPRAAGGAGAGYGPMPRE